MKSSEPKIFLGEALDSGADICVSEDVDGIQLALTHLDRIVTWTISRDEATFINYALANILKGQS